MQASFWKFISAIMSVVLSITALFPALEINEPKPIEEVNVINANVTNGMDGNDYKIFFTYDEFEEHYGGREFIEAVEYLASVDEKLFEDKNLVICSVSAQAGYETEVLSVYEEGITLKVEYTNINNNQIFELPAITENTVFIETSKYVTNVELIKCE